MSLGLTIVAFIVASKVCEAGLMEDCSRSLNKNMWQHNFLCELNPLQSYREAARRSFTPRAAPLEEPSPKTGRDHSAVRSGKYCALI
jgi:hypothetical protein